MALKLTFQDPATLLQYPDSHWEVALVNVNRLERTGFIILNGYPNVAAFNAEPRPMPFLRKTLNLTPQTYDMFFQATGINPESLYEPCYDFALLDGFFSTATKADAQ